MLYYQEQKWDRYRKIYLKIGFICSLFSAFVCINTNFKTDLAILNEHYFEDPHLDWSSLLNAKIQSPENLKRRIIKAPRKESFILKLDSSILKNSIDSSAFENPDTTAISGPVSKSGDANYKNVPKLEPAKQRKAEFVLIAERMPIFGECNDLSGETERNNCSNKQLLTYLYKHIKYPKRALVNGIEGMVLAQILIDQEGNVEQPKILRGIGEDCDNEVLRILSTMPKWSPGSQNGRKVKVQMKIPVQFKIRY